MRTDTKHLFLCFIGLFTILSLSNCSDSNDGPIISEELIGSWKIVGLGEVGSTIITTVEPTDCENCYVLNLKKEGIFYTTTTLNSITGTCTVQEHNTIKFEITLQTTAGELGNGYLYSQCLINATTYICSGTSLQLFYDNDKYILFKKTHYEYI
ncbi:hypothetical protein D0T50_05230 [Bacteroides sp. 214]|uniref:hypothetical protein n=1 Tax=Bacteroides sp. 214 TaxID=2302935 RepID=UPI0013CF909D|nr:hypothetical protein [Bacteroides sp. 214]NDW12291.1 hypothetical protein [Bacteroides sp. 214]